MTLARMSLLIEIRWIHMIFTIGTHNILVKTDLRQIWLDASVILFHFRSWLPATLWQGLGNIALSYLLDLDLIKSYRPYNCSKRDHMINKMGRLHPGWKGLCCRLENLAGSFGAWATPRREFMVRWLRYFQAFFGCFNFWLLILHSSHMVELCSYKED